MNKKHRTHKSKARNTEKEKLDKNIIMFVWIAFFSFQIFCLSLFIVWFSLSEIVTRGLWIENFDLWMWNLASKRIKLIIKKKSFRRRAGKKAQQYILIREKSHSASQKKWRHTADTIGAEWRTWPKLKLVSRYVFVNGENG